MVAARTTTDLLASVRLRAQLASTDGRISSAEILELADEVMSTSIAHLLVSSRSQRWTQAATDVAIASGTYLYALPERALGSDVQAVLITDGTNEWRPTEITLADAHLFRVGAGPWDAPFAICWRDDSIEVLPHPTSSGYSLRVLYARQPSRLCLTTACDVVSSKTSTTITTTATTVLAATVTVDVVSARPTGAPRGIDLAATTSSTTITIAAGVPSATVAGDYVAVAGTTPVPQCPENLWGALVEGTTLAVLAAIGDHEAASVRAGLAKRAEDAARDIIEPRSQAQSPKLVNRNGPLRLRRGFR